MARTHTQINAQKKTHTHRCRRSPAIKRSMSVPRGSECVSGPWQTNSCWTHRSCSSPTVEVICERRSSHHDISVPTCCGRAQSLSTWDKAPKYPSTHHHVTLLQAVERHCHLAAATQEKTSSICSVLMHGWLHLFAFYFIPWLGVSLLFYSCDWQWEMVSESRVMYRDEQHVL